MFHWVNLLLQPAEAAARESEWSAHDWKEFEHSGASVGFEWTRGEETGGQVHEVKIPDILEFFKGSGETPFSLFGSLLWQAEADTEMTLPASPTTAAGQNKRFYFTVIFLSSKFYQIVPLCTRASVVMVVLFILCNTPRIIPNAMELYYDLREMEKMTVRIIKQVKLRLTMTSRAAERKRTSG